MASDYEDLVTNAVQSTELAYLGPDVVRQRLRTLEALAPMAGEAVLDVGCGPGLLAHDLALAVGPQGRVVGIDNTPAMLARAGERCAALKQVSFKEGAVEDLPAEDGSFHALACVQVLLYVAEVQRAISEMQRVLRPGGRIALIETDWRGVVLNSGDDSLTRRMMAAWEAAVPSPNLPVRLSALLREQGFSAVRAEAIPILNLSYSPNNFSANTVSWVAEIAQKQGAASEDEAKIWLEDLRRLAREGAYFFCVNRFLFSAVKT